jgi:hypothetical protein
MSNVVALAAAALLVGCSVDSDSLWPSLTGDEPERPPAERVSVPPSQAEQNTQPTLSPGPTMQAQPSGQVQQTGTLVGRKVGELRGELNRLLGLLGTQNERLRQVRAATATNAQRYHGTVAAITSRLQLGTTPGNPILISQWNAAQAELDRVSNEIAQMNTLANEIAGNSSLAGYVLESARAAYGLTGAVDEDHRQLALLEDETNRAVVLIDRLLNEVNEDVARQTAYVANERSDLTTLASGIKNGELHGSSLLARAYSSNPSNNVAFGTSSTPRSGFSSLGRTALVVIRFDRADVAFQQALYTAVSKAMQARPNAAFDVVGVAPGGRSNSTTAINQSRLKKHANAVLRALVDMGLPANRVSLSAATGPSNTSNEVHVYIR